MRAERNLGTKGPTCDRRGSHSIRWQDHGGFGLCTWPPRPSSSERLFLALKPRSILLELCLEGLAFLELCHVVFCHIANSYGAGALADFLFLLQWLPQRSAQGQDSILTMNSVDNSTHFLRVKAGCRQRRGWGSQARRLLNQKHKM